ncbi:hypothetical protein Patl1_05898 [Pistacia atlantica]|uniref:Uncharacterized protein n=1 Tax=Pistacia atlantica TaxID=434234 RepID=A0ACC1BR24_9ROSI|nr:hypothetical protein Patl1_05898 [Pistacia atlantica]
MEGIWLTRSMACQNIWPNIRLSFSTVLAPCRHDVVISQNLSQEIVEELGIYIVSFDRAGYGESDPNPKRTIKSLAMDTEELADQLGLGSKFYVVGYSMGGQTVCLKYIPHRLAGATLIAPVINYWWPGFPRNLSTEAYNLQLPQDQWALRQVILKSSLLKIFNFSLSLQGDKHTSHKYFQQGAFESNHRDMMIGFGSWEFDPMDLQNPFPDGEGSVHIWQGDEDRLVPVILQRYIAKRLPWIQYHELQGGGHLFPLLDGMSESILKALLLHKEVTSV